VRARRPDVRQQLRTVGRVVPVRDRDGRLEERFERARVREFVVEGADLDAGRPEDRGDPLVLAARRAGRERPAEMVRPRIERPQRGLEPGLVDPDRPEASYSASTVCDCECDCDFDIRSRTRGRAT